MDGFTCTQVKVAVVFYIFITLWFGYCTFWSFWHFCYWYTIVFKQYCFFLSLLLWLFKILFLHKWRQLYFLTLLTLLWQQYCIEKVFTVLISFLMFLIDILFLQCVAAFFSTLLTLYSTVFTWVMVAVLIDTSDIFKTTVLYWHCVYCTFCVFWLVYNW